MNIRYHVELSQAERHELTALLSGGKHAARKLKRAQILLAADAGTSDDDIATSVGVGAGTPRKVLLSNAAILRLDIHTSPLRASALGRAHGGRRPVLVRSNQVRG